MINASIPEWSSWHPLRGISRNPSTPRQPGIYRVRRKGYGALEYIGQTGRSLRERLGALSRCHADQMPYRDPHTAAPALWALHHASGCEFEASFAEVPGDSHARKGLESLAIGLYRQEFGASPTVQYGRVPKGYRASSQNNSSAPERAAHQLLELENDLIAAHVLHLNSAPTAQFKG